MQLISMLLTTVAILTILSGAIVFFGSKKGSRVRSLWFFVATIFAMIWIASILFFLTAKNATLDAVNWHVMWVFISAVFIDTTFFAHIAWREKYGKILSIIFFVFCLALGSWIFCFPNQIYSEIILTPAGNSIKLNIGPLYYVYIAFFAIMIPAIIIMFTERYRRHDSKGKRLGDIVMMCSFGASSAVILVYDVLLPYFGNWEMSWLGPLALSVMMISMYYTILKYHSLNLASWWLRIFSYIVIIASLAIIYMVVFSLIFMALFRGAMPSTEVIALNFIMIAFFLALMPATNGVMVSVRTLIDAQKPGHKKDRK